MVKRVAALYDIHGNLPALEAVLRDVASANVDLVLVGGDVLPGPFVSETIAALGTLRIPTQFIRGNGEREVLQTRAGSPSALPEPIARSVAWVADQLTPEDERSVASWPLQATTDVEDIGRVVFVHATPRNDVDIFTRETDEQALVPVFDSVAAPLVVCGHTHMQFDRRIGSTRVVNAGSVGMPFGAPGAYWLLLGPDVELRRTAYDLNEAARRVRNTGYPAAEEFAAKNILAPPSEQAMLELFTPHSLK